MARLENSLFDLRFSLGLPKYSEISLALSHQTYLLAQASKNALDEPGVLKNVCIERPPSRKPLLIKVSDRRLSSLAPIGPLYH